MSKKKKQAENDTKKPGHRAKQKQRRMSTHISIFRKMKQLPEEQRWEMYGILEVHFEEWKWSTGLVDTPTRLQFSYIADSICDWALHMTMFIL